MTSDDAARCAVHAEVAGAEVCSRCGRFMCEACVGDRAPLRCAECWRDRWGALARGPFSLNAVFADGARLFFTHFNLALACALLMSIVNTALAYTLPMQRREGVAVSLAFNLAVSALGTTFFLLNLRDRVTGVTSTASQLAREANGRWPRVLLASFTYSVVFGFGLLLLVYPGARWGCAFVLCQCVAVLEPDSAPLKTSEGLTKGHLLEVLVVLMLTSVVYLTVSGATAGATWLLQQRGYETWLAALAGNALQQLVGLGSDALLFAAYVRLRYGRVTG